MISFSDVLREKFLSGQNNQFLIYGNVHDLFFHENSYLPLLPFLEKFLGKKRIVVHYNIASGIRFLDTSQAFLVANAYKSASFLGHTPNYREAWFQKMLQEGALNPQLALKFLEECSRLTVSDKETGKSFPFAIVIDYAETLAPSGANERLSDQDRQKIVILSQWLSDPAFNSSTNLILFICDTQSSFNQKITNLPSLALIPIPRPDHEERLRFIRFQCHQKERTFELKCSQTHFASFTAGLTLKGMEHLFLSAEYMKEKLDETRVIEKTNEIITKELGEIIEIFRPDHNLKAVIGATQLKKHLHEQIKIISIGDPQISPVGILVTGPNGGGKTFIFEAFAEEIGYNIVKLKKIRSQWFGETDVIFEKLKSVLTGLGKVVVFIDEADTAFGGRSKETHETEKRLFGNIIKMMGDPVNRGKIIWILITARPDNLEPDIKRSGRAGLHFPVLDPQGDDREKFIEYLFKKAGIHVDNLSTNLKKEFMIISRSFSAADFQELIILLKAKFKIYPRFTSEQIMEVIKDYIPVNSHKERRYQTLAAVSECSFQSLIPEDMKDMEKVRKEMQLLKQELGY